MKASMTWLALFGGMLSFFSPCILPVAPGYLAILSGASLTDLESGKVARRRIILITLAFVLGFTSTFVLLGLGSSLAGQFLRGNRNVLTKAGGFVVLLLGLHQAGWLKIPWLYHEKRLALKPTVGMASAFLTGLVFGVGWTPCVGPILGSILALAGGQETIGAGIFLLFVYSAGMALPFIILAFAFDKVAASLKRVKPYLKYSQLVSGVFLIFIGLLLLTGNFTLLSIWFNRITGGWSPEQLLPK